MLDSIKKHRNSIKVYKSLMHHGFYAFLVYDLYQMNNNLSSNRWYISNIENVIKRKNKHQ